jgi:hypothetical protein
VSVCASTSAVTRARMVSSSSRRRPCSRWRDPLDWSTRCESLQARQSGRLDTLRMARRRRHTPEQIRGRLEAQGARAREREARAHRGRPGARDRRSAGDREGKRLSPSRRRAAVRSRTASGCMSDGHARSPASTAPPSVMPRPRVTTTRPCAAACARSMSGVRSEAAGRVGRT